MGTIAQAQYEKRYTKIQINRTASADFLTFSASQANLASTIWKVHQPAAKLALIGTLARQETLQSKQSQRGFRFYFYDLAAKIIC
jgi:hypothetical protein